MAKTTNGERSAGVSMVGERRAEGLPPYLFAEVDQLKQELRRSGRDVIDLGFGNPDIPSPEVAVEKLREAALRPANHRYSASRGIVQLRRAIAERYESVFGVTLDPDRQVVATIGAKEGLSHLLWAVVTPGDQVLVPTPTYPIHRVAPQLAGATVVTAPADGGVDALAEALESSHPRVVIASFPHNPTTTVATPADMQRLVDLALEREFLIVHDFAYADIAFDGHRPPSILAARGAMECAVELYSLTKSFSMAGWRVGFAVGQAEAVQALTKLKSYLDYGTFQPIQIASIVALREAADYPREVCEIYSAPSRRALLRSRAGRLARHSTGRDDVRAGLDLRAASPSSVRSSWRCASRARRGLPSVRVRGSEPAGKVTSGSCLSRTSNGSARPLARSASSSELARCSSQARCSSGPPWRLSAVKGSSAPRRRPG